MKKQQLLLLGIFLSISTLSFSQARVQFIHNSADAATAVVDVWLDDTLILDNFSFRTASVFMDVPSGQAFTISIQPPESTSHENPIWSQNYSLDADETYLFMANGIISPTGYKPAIPFDIYVFSGALEQGVNPSFTDAVMFHGITDAPSIDVVETGIGLGPLVQDFPYSYWAGYASLLTEDYIIEIRASSNDEPIASFNAPLATLHLGGQAVTVVTSGFLNPEENSNGAAFGLYLALSSGGEFLSLPILTGINEQTAIHAIKFFPNPAKDEVTISFNLETSGEVDIDIFNLVGTQVYTERLENKAAGLHSKMINTESLKEGIYFLKITSNNSPLTRKLMISR